MSYQIYVNTNGATFTIVCDDCGKLESHDRPDWSTIQTAADFWSVDCNDLTEMCPTWRLHVHPTDKSRVQAQCPECVDYDWMRFN